MRHSLAAGRHSRDALAETPIAARTGRERDSMVARARAGGWDVVGYQWLRITRSGVTIEVWFSGDTGRVVRARHHAADGRIRDLDIVHDREQRSSLAAVVAQWLDAPDQNSVRTHRAIRSGSAAQSTEFEAISISAARASRPAPDAGADAPRPRTSTWVRTDLSPA